MEGNDGGTVFDFYKLHAELAERVGALREDPNELHTDVVS